MPPVLTGTGPASSIARSCAGDADLGRDAGHGSDRLARSGEPPYHFTADGAGGTGNQDHAGNGAAGCSYRLGNFGGVRRVEWPARRVPVYRGGVGAITGHGLRVPAGLRPWVADVSLEPAGARPPLTRLPAVPCTSGWVPQGSTGGRA